jgi:hypothetical protein
VSAGETANVKLLRKYLATKILCVCFRVHSGGVFMHAFEVTKCSRCLDLFV